MAATKRFIITLAISLAVYAVLDFGFNSMMLYIMGGVVGGSISEAFKAVGVKVGTVPIALLWTALLIGVVALFYRLQNKSLKYFIIILIAALLYVVNIVVGEIVVTYMPESEEIDKVAMIDKVVLWMTIIFKSLILSLIVYFDGKRKEEKATA